MSRRNRSTDLANPPRFTHIPKLGKICRLGLATRGNTDLDGKSVLEAVDRGVNYLNWCGYPDGMRDAIRNLGQRRQDIRIAVQLSARTAEKAMRELDGYLEDLKTDYLDVVTYYYVEDTSEWQQIIGPGGAADAMERAQRDGMLRAIGLTSHQRDLAAQFGRSGQLDLLMVRYNAAHRGAERDIFPVATQFRLSTVVFTCLRWGALLNGTPGDPTGFTLPSAPAWYRFVLCNSSVNVALMAPNGPDELRDNLTLLDDWHGYDPQEYDALAAHGQRVRQHARSFP